MDHTVDDTFSHVTESRMIGRSLVGLGLSCFGEEDILG